MSVRTSAFLATCAALAFSACSGGGSSSATGGGPGRLVNDVLQRPFTGTKRVLVIPAGFQDPGQGPLFEDSPAGRAQLDALLQTVVDSVGENSDGALGLDFDVVWPPLAIPKDSTDYDPATGFVTVRADVLAAAAVAGFDASSYDREVLFVPRVWPGAARGWVRTVWMPNTIPWILYHEIGHTMGWGHANFWDGDPLGAGTEEDYGDVFDPMGTGRNWNRYRTSGPRFQDRAGWLASGEVQPIAQSGTYRIASIELADTASDPIALTIRAESGETYWLFHRREEEFARDGVLVVRARSNPYLGTLLLDMNRGAVGSGGDEVLDARLGLGQVFDDVARAIQIETLAVDNDGVSVAITVDEARQAALDAEPQIELVAPAADGPPLSGLVSFDVAAADPNEGLRDGDGIAKVTLEVLQPTVDPFLVVASVERLEAPFVWEFDTTALLDAPYYLAVTAETLDGGTRTIWSRFLVQNGVESRASRETLHVLGVDSEVLCCAGDER